MLLFWKWIFHYCKEHFQFQFLWVVRSTQLHVTWYHSEMGEAHIRSDFTSDSRRLNRTGRENAMNITDHKYIYHKPEVLLFSTVLYYFLSCFKRRNESWLGPVIRVVFMNQMKRNLPSKHSSHIWDGSHHERNFLCVRSNRCQVICLESPWESMLFAVGLRKVNSYMLNENRAVWKTAIT